jgi:proton-translocating NADH-quinone oxidoreductase chain N
MSLPPFMWLILWLILAAPFVYLIGRINILTGTKQIFARWLSLLCIAVAWGAFGRVLIDFYGLGGFDTRASTELISQATWRLGLVTMRFDGISLLLAALVLTLTTAILIFSGYYIGRSDGSEKHYALVLLLCGTIVGLGSAGDLFNLWIWFEAMAIASLPLIVFYREDRTSLEAGLKYLIQSSTGSVFILLGIALILFSTGTLDILIVREATKAWPGGGTPLWLTAGALFIVGFGIKVALVPLHTWLPDAHAQAPSGISAILSAVVIQAGLIALLRALSSLTGAAATWGIILIGFGVLNMLLGNLLALRQQQVKRLLAFSSISHVGYMVVGLGVALFVGTAAGAQAGFFHLISHGLMKGLAFLAVGTFMFAFQQGFIIRESEVDHHRLTIDDLNGAARHYPLIALVFSLALLGLGGLPPMVGFMSKWQIMFAGAQAPDRAFFLILIIIALSSVLSLAYYAPIVNAMYRQKPAELVTRGRSIPLSMTFPLVLLAFAIVILGIFPLLAGWLTIPAASDLLAAFGL